MMKFEQIEAIGNFGHWEYDHIAETFHWSDQAFIVFNKNKSEFIPTRESFLQIVHPDDRGRLIAIFDGFECKGDTSILEHRIVLEDNSVRYVAEQCETMCDDKGRPVKTIGVVRDITEQTAVFQQLQESQEKFEAISNQTTEGITVADMDGNYVFVNPAFCKMSGYTEEELLKLTVFDMKAANQDHSSFRKSKEKYQGKALGVNLERKDGTEYYTEIIGDLIHVDNETLVLGTIRDVSDRLKQEIEIQKLNQNLESLVSERTKELNSTVEALNAEIEQRKLAEEKMRESLEVKELLLKEITHRVKNNMQIISSIINLQKGSMDQERCEFLDQIGHRIHSMALIHETLYKTEDFESVEFRSYLTSLVEYLKESFDHPGIEIRLKIEETTLPLDVATCCGMIILELITNSIKHAFEEMDTGLISVQLSNNGAGAYNLKIGDNGPGIPDSVDYRDSHSLGLQLVMSLVDQITGEIDHDNSGGSEFNIRFTVVKTND